MILGLATSNLFIVINVCGGRYFPLSKQQLIQEILNKTYISVTVTVTVNNSVNITTITVNMRSSFNITNNETIHQQ